MAQSGNGIDIGTIYGLLTQMSARLDQLFAIVNEHTRILNDHTRILNDHARQLDDLRVSVASLRADVGHYHDAVIGQGIHYSGLEGRVLRIERHLKLESGE